MKTNLPAQQALDKKADNARELGLDYEPAQTDWEAVAADQAMTIALLRAEQPSQHQEPVGTVQCINGVTIGYLDVMQPVGTKLYTAPQPAQQEPWGACVHGRVFVGRLPDHVRKFSEDEGMPIQWLYTSPQPAQPAQQEPVAKDDADIYEFWARNKETERQQKPMAYDKPWVGLSDEEMDDCWNKLFGTGNYNRRNVYRAIEAKLKEKNT